MTCEDLCYVGMKVKIIDVEAKLYGTLLDEYNALGYIKIVDIFENGNVRLSNGELWINYHKSDLIPIVDENILTVLDIKIKESKRIDKEIRDIKKFINDTISKSLKEES